MQFSIPVDTVKALLLAAGKNDPRYYLNGVCIDVRATDTVAVATNGHMLVALPVTLDDGVVPIVGQYIIPRDVLEGLKPAYKGATATITIDPATQKVLINTGGTSVSASLVDGAYPTWRRVVPREVSGAVSQFGADYISAFGKINKLLGSKYSPSIAHNGLGAARILLTGEAVGVLMPVRDESAVSRVENPSWIEHDPSQSAAA